MAQSSKGPLFSRLLFEGAEKEEGVMPHRKKEINGRIGSRGVKDIQESPSFGTKGDVIEKKLHRRKMEMEKKGPHPSTLGR